MPASKVVCVLVALLTLVTLASLVAVPPPACAAGTNEPGTISVAQAGSSKLKYDVYRLIAGDVVTRDGAAHIENGIPTTAYLDTLAVTLKAAGYDPSIAASDTPAAQSAKISDALARAAKVDPTAANGAQGIQQVAMAISRALAKDGATPTTTAYPTSDGTLKVTGLATGYYLIATNEASLNALDTADSQVAPSALLIALPKTGAESVLKARVPGVTKQIAEVDEAGKIDWGKIADAEMLEWTPYRLTGTLPTNWSEFTSYHYEFTDKLDDALELDRSSVKVSLLDAKGKAVQDLTSAFTVSFQNQTISVTCADLKSAAPQATASHTVRVTYNARLVPQKATIGTRDPADNYVYLTYTREPYSDGTGRTPEDRARLLTWAIDLTKIDARVTTKRLAGAAFTLQDHAGKYVQADGSVSTKAYEFVTNDEGKATAPGLDAGTYILTEVRAPEGYARIADPVKITITHDLDEQAARLGAKLDHSAVTVARTDAAKGTVSLAVINEESLNTPNKPKFPGWLPQTGDVAPLIVLVLAATGTALIAGALRLRTARKGNE